MSQQSGSLDVVSFHSVKGGVGKTSMAVKRTRELAGRGEGPVVLLDWDFMGPSLADRLELAEPVEGPGRTIDDWVLYATPDWTEAREAPLAPHLWPLVGVPGAYVVPTSTSLAARDRILPVMMDEPRAAFMEGRLERFLAALVREHTSAHVVIDTGPGLTPWSLGVVSLGLRLTAEPKMAIAAGAEVLPELVGALVSWTAGVLVSRAPEDQAAMRRWAAEVQPGEERVLHWVDV